MWHEHRDPDGNLTGAFHIPDDVAEAIADNPPPEPDLDKHGLPATLFGIPVVVDDSIPTSEPPKLGQWRTQWPIKIEQRDDGTFIGRFPKNASFIDSGEPDEW